MKNRLFGTDGIRDIAGTNALSLQNLPLLGAVFGAWITQCTSGKPKILIAHDTRNSSDFMKTALLAGMLTHDVTVYDAGVLPTPALCSIIRYTSQFDFGIMISASHNSYEHNGIKIVDHNGDKLDFAAEAHITTLYTEALKGNGVTAVPAQFGTVTPWHKGNEEYMRIIDTVFSHNCLHTMRIVVDCAHGATHTLAPAVFTRLGATVITINASPNGTNINHACGSLHTSDLQHAVHEHNADIGFAYDGDGDRIVVVTKDGVVKDGDDLLALLSTHPLYAHQTTVVGTIMSNSALKKWLSTNQKNLIITAVGDKQVDQALRTHNLLLGGEQSGHIIVHDFLSSSDSIYVSLRIIETMLLTNNAALTTFAKFPQHVVNMPVTSRKDLTNPMIENVIQKYASQIPDGRIHIRYSGTENILRILLEDSDEQIISEMISPLKIDLTTTLQSL